MDQVTVPGTVNMKNDLLKDWGEEERLKARTNTPPGERQNDERGRHNWEDLWKLQRMHKRPGVGLHGEKMRKRRGGTFPTKTQERGGCEWISGGEEIRLAQKGGTLKDGGM